MSDILRGAKRKRDARMAETVDLLDRRITIWGYGWKGRGLAHHARDVGWDVTVFDIAADRRAAAAREDFRVRSDLPEREPIVLAATQAQSELAGRVGERGVFFQELAFLLNMPCLENFAREYAEYVEHNADACYEVLTSLDPVGAQRYLRLVTFRVSCNPLDLADSNEHVSKMWFDDALIARKSEIRTFLDVGAFDGDTIRAARRHLDIEEAIGLEMSADLVRRIHEQHDGTYALHTHNVAAWSDKGHLGQALVGDGMLRVESDASGGVPCDTLDNLATSRIDLIKMDIEGAERPALAGAQRIIREDKPFLAIAAYHRPEDIVEIFRIGASFGYSDIRFAHYSQCLDDSIFYFMRG
ncbi:FkbM family methyltransferase [Methylobacterium sp. A54F]